MANHPVAAHRAHGVSIAPRSIFDNVPDPRLDWTTRHPERALALLMVSPRPCAALDHLLGL